MKEKKKLALGLILGLVVILNNITFAEEISGWPRMDRSGVPIGWNSAQYKWVSSPRAFDDVNGNGKENVVIPKGHGIAVFEKNDDGKWIEIAEKVPSGDAAVSLQGNSVITVGDTDADGKKEIFFGMGQARYETDNACRVYVFEHTKGNDFTQVGVLGPYGKKQSSAVRFIGIADTNMDGKQEVVVTHAYRGNHYVRIYAADADNHWEEVTAIDIAKEKKGFYYPNSVAVADLDNDKRPELYVGVEYYDKGAEKTHGWLYVYKMTEKNHYIKVWQSDDMGSYIRDVRFITEKTTGEVLIAGQLGIRGTSWALFKPVNEKNYRYLGRKTWQKIKELYVVGLIDSSHRKEVKVGVYHAGKVLGAKGIYEGLKRNSGISISYINNFDQGTLLAYDVIILPAIHSIGAEKKWWRERIRSYVASGGGIILCHDTVGYRRIWSTPLFPEIEKGISKKSTYTVIVKDASHPICKGLSAEFKHAYYDHINMEVTDKGKAVIGDKDGNNVVVAGGYGKGGVVAMGNICGWSDADTECAPEGDELMLMFNSIHWLTESKQGVVDSDFKIVLQKEVLKSELEASKKTVFDQIRFAEWELETKLDFISFDLNALEGILLAKQYTTYKKKFTELKKVVSQDLESFRKDQNQKFDVYYNSLNAANSETELRKIKETIAKLPRMQNIRKWVKVYPLMKRHNKYIIELKNFIEKQELIIDPLSEDLTNLKNKKISSVVEAKSNKCWLKDTFITMVINHYGNFVPGYRETLRYLGEYGVAEYNDASIYRFKDFYTYNGYDTQEDYIKETLTLCNKYNIRFFAQPGRSAQGIPGIKKYRRVNIAKPEMLEREKKIVKYVVEQCGSYPAFAGQHWDEPEFDVLSLLPDKGAYSGKNFGDGKYLQKEFREHLMEKYSHEELQKMGINVSEQIVIPIAKERTNNIVIWVEYQEFVAQIYENYYKELFAYAHSLKKDFIAHILLTPMHFSTFLATPQSSVYKMGADMINTDVYWAGSPSEAFAFDLLRSGTKVPTLQTVGVFYGGTAETYRRDLAMTYAHTQGCYIFDWCGFFKQRQYWDTGGREIDSSQKMWQATTEFWERTKKIEQYLVGTTSPSQIALLFSERTAGIDYYKPGNIGGDYLSNQIGIYRALAQEHIQCDPIHATGLTKQQLANYKVLILSNARSLTIGQMTLIRNWVKQGGYLIATGSSSLYDRWGRKQKDYQLKDLFGLSYIQTQEFKENAVFRQNNYDVNCNLGKYELIKVTTGKVRASWQTGEPAVVVNKYGRGNSIFLSYNYPGLSFTGAGSMSGRFLGSVRNMHFSS